MIASLQPLIPDSTSPEHITENTTAIVYRTPQPIIPLIAEHSTVTTHEVSHLQPSAQEAVCSPQEDEGRLVPANCFQPFSPQQVAADLETGDVEAEDFWIRPQPDTPGPIPTSPIWSRSHLLIRPLNPPFPGFENLILALPDFAYRNVYSQVDLYFDCYDQQDQETITNLFAQGIIRVVPPPQAVRWYDTDVQQALDKYVPDLIEAVEGAILGRSRLGREISLQRPRELDPPLTPIPSIPQPCGDVIASPSSVKSDTLTFTSDSGGEAVPSAKGCNARKKAQA